MKSQNSADFAETPIWEQMIKEFGNPSEDIDDIIYTDPNGIEAVK